MAPEGGRGVMELNEKPGSGGEPEAGDFFADGAKSGRGQSTEKTRTESAQTRKITRAITTAATINPQKRRNRSSRKEISGSGRKV